MKLLEFTILDHQPIKRFEASELSEVIVMAGPNGVGKTRTLNALLNHFKNPGPGNVRIKLTSTSADERKRWQGAPLLDTGNARHAEILRQYLQRQQKRGELRGGVLNFDSSRAFENVKPYQFTWDAQDPFEEIIGWDFSFNTVRNRFQDVIHSMLRKVRSHKEHLSDRAVALIAEGKRTMELPAYDPLEKFKTAFSSLLPGKTLLDLMPKTQEIQYSFKGSTLSLSSLSSGEREVVTIVFDFLLRNPHDCIIVFDEPELHLHPELSYRLLRTLRQVGSRNQFIFCTHSPDIITASLDQTVIFVSPERDATYNQAVTVKEGDENSSILNLLGQSIGVISLGQKLVLIEGEKSSLDKQT